MNFKAVKGRVLIKLDTKQKERYSFADGTIIHAQKGFNFNRREDVASMSIIIDGEGLPEGAELLVHHNSFDVNNEITEWEDFITEREYLDGYRILSIPDDMAFMYKENGEWQPCKQFLITSRIFEPYKGKIVGIEPAQVKNRMYVLKGKIKAGGKEIDLAGQVALTTDNCDYQIIWHDTNNKEQSIIRTRCREVMGVDHAMKKLINKGKLLIGLSPTLATTLK